MSELLDLFAQAKQSWLAANDRYAAEINARSLDEFNRQSRSYADNPGLKMPKPVAPSMVKAVQTYEPWPKCEFVPTGIPVSMIDPDSLKPVIQSDVDAVGGPVGGPVRNETGGIVIGKFMKSSTDTYWPGQIFTDPKTGNKYVKVAISPFDQYWLRI
jgi:hypothetical protein